MKQAIAAVFLCAAGTASVAGEAVRFPGPGVELSGRLYLPVAGGRLPAIVMLHGCSGMWGRRGEPTASYNLWAEHFRDRGYVVLLIDSFGPRDEKEICTQAYRRVRATEERPRDAYAGLHWLAKRNDVDAGRIHVMGWSNGGDYGPECLAAGCPGPGGVGSLLPIGGSLLSGLCSRRKIELQRLLAAPHSGRRRR